MTQAKLTSHLLLEYIVLMMINNSFGAHIFFDLGGVLLEPDIATIIRHDPLNLIYCFLRHGGNPRKALFAKLATVEPFMDYPITIFDEQGNEVPPIFRDFLAGLSADQILTRISLEWSKSDSLYKMARLIFDPTIFAKSQKFIAPGVRFVEECIEQGHCVYILSNWDAESFTFLQDLYPEFFGLFSGIIISGDCHLLKPDPAIYTYAIKKFELDPRDCIFIDNQEENILAATNATGMHGILCPPRMNNKPNFAYVHQQFNQWISERQTAEMPG